MRHFSGLWGWKLALGSGKDWMNLYMFAMVHVRGLSHFLVSNPDLLQVEGFTIYSFFEEGLLSKDTILSRAWRGGLVEGIVLCCMQVR